MYFTEVYFLLKYTVLIIKEYFEMIKSNTSILLINY